MINLNYNSENSALSSSLALPILNSETYFLAILILFLGPKNIAI